MNLQRTLKLSARIGSGHERGAALYVALIMLLLLALIGLAGLRVVGMQERMAANFLQTSRAFQNAEGALRRRERTITQSIQATGKFTSQQEACSPSFDPSSWAKAVTAPDAAYVRRIDKCFAASSRRIGNKLNEETGNIYQISTYSSNDSDNPTASAALDTIYIP